MNIIDFLRSLFRRPKPPGPAPPPRPPVPPGDPHPPPPHRPPPPPPPVGPDNMALAVNFERLARKLNPLTYDPSLTIESQRNNVEQARRGLGHYVTSNDYQCADVGSATARECVGVWMNSPAHRKILLNPGLTRIGWDKAGVYWTASFR